MLITWEPPPPSQRNGVITYYTVLVTSDSGQKQVYNVSAGQLSLRIQGNVMAIFTMLNSVLSMHFFCFLFCFIFVFVFCFFIGGAIIVMMCLPIKSNVPPYYFEEKVSLQNMFGMHSGRMCHLPLYTCHGFHFANSCHLRIL